MGQLLSMHSGSQGRTPNSLLQFFPADFKHIFFFAFKREPSRLLITNPVGSQVAGNFIKQNSPGSFNRGAQEAKTPLALWPNTKAQLQTSFPHSVLPVTLFSCLLFTSVSTPAHWSVLQKWCGWRWVWGENITTPITILTLYISLALCGCKFWS